ncbi:hypothetical protein FS749_002097 [Ceratobasidium sp. UAMH 11750]|nr:hypothetical protein FS749_002097 [Ceratobasidium sp. UAMH 11750]
MIPGQPHAKQKRTSEALDVQDPPDDPGAEMAKEARVWRDYVRETDRWDKEMVEGRNNSLDVLMIFATLFSAISTALVILSLSDLKPDYAKESAQTLLIVSRTLGAISNNYSAPIPFQPVSSTATSSPPCSAVVANVLLLLSLSLSVVVSLFAMLGKEWCYKFMSGRYGQIYDQARRRQKRWNGIELWKMSEVLMYLPWVMHLALRE